MSQVAAKIAAEIREQGPIPFRRFMELALYCPVFGYYEKIGDTPGRRGDYFTSVSVGSLFGELLAWQFADWIEREISLVPRPPGPVFRLVEAGAHGGQLASDILRWLRDHRPGLFRQIEYWIVEPSPRRRQWQQSTLAEFGSGVCWAGALHDLGPVSGIVFSNELLDSMPVHRLGWDARERAWFEWGVTSQDERFVWTRLPARNCPEHILPEVPAEVAAVLPDRFTLEISPAARNWWADAAGALVQGKLLTFDYGFTALQPFSPERTDGTLRAYRRHQVSGDLLADPGEQDLTAHVDFELLRRVGESKGLQTEALVSQAQYLTGIAARIWQNDPGFGAWSPQQRRQFQTLTHPEHLGHVFTVLVQSAKQP